MEELEDKEMDTYVFNIQFLGSYRSGRSAIIGKLATGVFNYKVHWEYLVYNFI